MEMEMKKPVWLYYVKSYSNNCWVEVPYQVYLNYEGDKKAR